MSNLSTLPKGDSAWLLRKAIQRVAQQINTLETNVNPAATGGSLNTQVLFNDAGAVKGDPDFTYNKTTDTLTATNGQFTNLNASGNTALNNLTVSGTFTALGGMDVSGTRAAANDYTAVAFDGVTSDSRVTSTLTGQNVGTGDFSVWSRFRVPASTSSQIRPMLALTSNASTPNQAESAHLFIAATGELSFRLLGTTASDLRNASVSGFLAAYTGQVVDVVVTRTGTTVKIYINGVDTAFTETIGGTPPAWSATVTSTFCNVGLGLGGGIYNERIYRTVVFNRALPAADVSSLILLGVNPADQWGVTTPVYTSDFSFDTNGWNPNSNMTVTGNIDAGADGAGVPPTNDWLRTTLTASRTLSNYRNNTLVVGKRYVVTGNIFVPSGSPVTHAFFNATAASDPANGGVPATATPVTAGSVTAVSSEFVARNHLLGTLGNNSSSVTSWGSLANGTSLYQKDVVVTRIGAFIDLDFTVGSGRIAYDRSTNNLHGVFFGGAAWNSPTNAPDSQSAIRAAASDYAAVMFDGATASTRIAAPCQALGTGDFSTWNRIRVPVSGFASGQFPGIMSLSDVNATASRTNGFRILLADNGSLQVSRFGSTTSDIRTATISGFRAAYSGQVVDINVTRAGATIKIYINGTDTAYTETTSGTAPAWSDTIVSDFVLVGCTSSAASNVFTGRIFRSVVFNRALSASDVTELITTGVNPSDQWGSQSSIYTSNFTAGVDSFASVSAGVVTVTGNETAPDATTGWLKAVRAAAGSGRSDVQRSGTLVGFAKRFRASATIYNVDCGTQWWGLQADNVTDTRDSSAQVSNGSSAVVSQEFASTNATTLRIGPAPSATGFPSAGGVPSGSTYYVKNVTITRIGAVVDLDFTVGTGYQAHDRSTNALHGTLFNGVEFSIPKRVAVLYATTNTNGNQQMLASLAIPTNAIIEDIIVNSTGTATVSVGNASGGTQIVNGASVVAGRQKLTIATPFSTTGNLWVNSNSTATLQFTILYTIAA